MGSRMQGFTVKAQQYPQKRPASERINDFEEISPELLAAKAEEQASRCAQCGVPFCQVHCPLHNHIPDWLKLAAEGRMREAYELSSATSTMPEICGRICPQDRLCEGNCVIESAGHGAVTIGAVEKYITDTAWEEGWVEPVTPVANREDQSAGIIGAGPAGLAAAELLRRRGYAVHVYDRHDRAGGLMTYGIPGFKLDKAVVMRRIRRLEEGGIQFHLGVEIGRDLPFAALRQRHDVLLIATGVYQPRPLGLPAVGARTIKALDYLIASNRKGFGDAVPAFDSGELNAAGRRVVVIGGGDTAMDCVRTAIRQGAVETVCLYRRDRANMPGSAREVANAEEEGVRFEWLAAPRAIDEQGIVAVRMRLGSPDVSGRRNPEPVPDSDFRIRADLVIEALGFDPEPLPELFAAPDLATTRWGTVRARLPALATSLPGVFAAGDIVRGASLVVWALREGRDVADAMHDWLVSNKSAARQGKAA